MDFRGIVEEELYEAKGQIDVKRVVKAADKSGGKISMMIWKEVENLQKILEREINKSGLDIKLTDIDYEAFDVKGSFYIVAYFMFSSPETEDDILDKFSFTTHKFLLGKHPGYRERMFEVRIDIST